VLLLNRIEGVTGRTGSYAATSCSSSGGCCCCCCCCSAAAAVAAATTAAATAEAPQQQPAVQKEEGSPRGAPEMQCSRIDSFKRVCMVLQKRRLLVSDTGVRQAQSMVLCKTLPVVMRHHELRVTQQKKDNEVLQGDRRRMIRCCSYTAGPAQL